MDFGIESTTLGNQSMLDDLLGSDAATATTDPKDIKPIDTTNPANPDKDKKDDKKDDTPPTGDFLNDLLGDGTDDVDSDGKTDDSKKVDDKDKAPDTTTKTDTTDAPPFEKLAKDFFALNLFSLDEGETEPEIKTPEEFIERVEMEKKKGAVEILENFIGRYGQDYQDAFDAIFNKGVNPKEYFSTYNNIVDYSSLDLTKESNQEKVVRDSLTDQGYDAEDIDAKIQKLKDYSDLEDEAKRAQKILVKKESAKLEQKTRESEARQQREIKEKQQYVSSVNTILSDKLKTKEFDGIPLNIETAREVADSLVTEKWQAPDGTKLTDFDKDILDLKLPENHVMKVKVALLMKILKKDPTLSTIQRKGVTAKSKELFANTVGKDEKQKQTDSNNKAGTGWF